MELDGGRVAARGARGRGRCGVHRFVPPGHPRAERRCRAGQFTDRFTKAVDQLDRTGPEHLQARLGAIHALDRLARDSSRDQGTVMNLSDRCLDRAALAAANLGRANLANADLAQAHLAYANLGYADFTGAYLAGSNLTGAYLADSDLTGADLTGARHDENTIVTGAVVDERTKGAWWR